MTRLRFAFWSLLLPVSVLAAPQFIEERFDLPAGFRVYRAAGPELSGGSYDIAFDGQGRLLVGDGTAVRRLKDNDGDGVFDGFEVIATGLGWRGPQGLLVYGDKLYAVGGDGIQLFEGYGSAAGLVHKGRIGQPFKTGGDHEGHTIFRGHDGYLYFMSGDGGGTRDRLHITESNSPVLFERAASVFRISPDGKRWECVSAGGRNPPNLGQNYLGELFSFDSDMEWHVGLPWWRPVRLNHWLVGGDQGWQQVGAYPPYYIDCLPGVLDIGRGSPTWGVFYEHKQFPERYQDAFVVCDYRWKRESNDQYATTGRLVVFFLRRDGAGWKATMETFARPKPGAVDHFGKPINFALVDIEVAPDGSLFVSDHNQGIWRIAYAPEKALKHFAEFSRPRENTLDALLSLPQPASEWSRLAEEDIKSALGSGSAKDLQAIALDENRSARQRLRAIRLLAAEFNDLPGEFLTKLSITRDAEVRGQAAWLLGLRNNSQSAELLPILLRNDDPFVRRRAAEAFTRLSAEQTNPIIDAMGDSERLVRYAAMAALAHHPTERWFATAAAKSSPQIQMRALVATNMRRESPSPGAVRGTIADLLRNEKLSREDHLDLLRILGIFREQLGEKEVKLATGFLREHFPHSDPDISFEQARLLGEYRVSEAFSKLLAVLTSERDYVRQFHFGQAIARLTGGWTSDEERRLIRWFLDQQRGWFAEFTAKGVEFPQFWATVLADVGKHHRTALLERKAQVDLSGLLGGVFVDCIAETGGVSALIDLYDEAGQPGPRERIVRRLARMKASDHPRQQELIVQAFLQSEQPELLQACAEFLSQQKNLVPRAGLAARAIGRMGAQNRLFVPMEKFLRALSGTNGSLGSLTGRIDQSQREQTIAYWKAWYTREFNQDLAAAPANPERSDEEIYRLIVDRAGMRGDAARGAQIYETLQCNTCHSGGVTPGREGHIFGPDLAGVTRRLNRAEFADSLVYPSKQVADRFKAYEVTLNDGRALTGFITEQNDRSVTLVDRDQVRQLERKNIASIQPQQTSLMPDKLLNRLTVEELAHLLAFLDR